MRVERFCFFRSIKTFFACNLKFYFQKSGSHASVAFFSLSFGFFFQGSLLDINMLDQRPVP